MTSRHKQQELISLARDAVDLFSRLSSAINEWADDTEQQLEAEAREKGMGSSLSNASSDSSKEDPLPVEEKMNLPKLPAPTSEAGVQIATQAGRHYPQYNGGRSLSTAITTGRAQEGQVPESIRPRKKRRDAAYGGQLEAGARPNARASCDAPARTKSGKRLRINWSEEENNALFRTLQRFPSYGEEDVVREIVKALGGSRTRFQTKGRFRNLLASGRIRASGTSPPCWVVDDSKKGRGRKSQALKERGHRGEEQERQRAESARETENVPKDREEASGRAQEDDQGKMESDGQDESVASNREDHVSDDGFSSE